MARKKIVVANWKMHPVTLTDAKKLFAAVRNAAVRLKSTYTVVCPPFLYASVLPIRGSKKFFLGAQDVSGEAEGAHTGEISSAMLKNLGVAFVLVGHSERRALGEDNALVQRKLQNALAEKLSVILCVGERERDKEGNYHSFLREELVSALQGVSRADLRRIIVAYEPIWAIDKTAADAMAPSDVQEMVIFIRKTVTELFDRAAAERTLILYGGSVEASNAPNLFTEASIDGFLVGHTSLDPDAFGQILRAVDAS